MNKRTIGFIIAIKHAHNLQRLNKKSKNKSIM